MAQRYIEVQLTETINVGDLLALVDDPDILGAWELDGILRIYWPDGSRNPEIMDSLRSAVRQLGGADEDVILSAGSIPDQDWDALWAESLRPIRVGKRFLIRQSWNPVEVRSGEVELIIDPKRAFGTGYHETTQLLLEWMEDHVRGGERVLDWGTGSGILAMASLKMGAASAVGIDNDPDAIACAREYAALNGFGGELVLLTSSLEDLETGLYDLVLANLDRAALIEGMGRLGRFIGREGSVLLSGVQVEDYEDLARAAADANGEVVSHRERNDWLAMHVRFATDSRDC